jgi:TonB family protein
VGPPNDYYEIIVVRPASAGSSVERLLLTPAAGCFQPAKVEFAAGSISESVSELLGNANPCSIPEKELRRELKRCKKCLVFSGANIAMHVKCGGQDRLIRADILDRDMFDAAPNTPQNTSWTMRLLDKLDKVIGPGVLDKPIFPELSDKDEAVAKTHRLLSLKEVEAGDYDLLFQGAPDTASELFRASQITAVKPSIRLVSSTPCAPKEFVNPNYPPIAKLARVEGKVEVHLKVANDGTVTHFEFKAGHPILRIATEEAVSKWTFPAEAAGQEIEVVLEFNTNCPKDTK